MLLHRCLVVIACLVPLAFLACTKKGEEGSNADGSGASAANQPNAGNGSGGLGAGGLGAGGLGAGGLGSGGLGSGGASGAGGAATGGAAACPTDANLVLHGGWVGCDPASTTDNPQGLQGSFYMFGDGSSCTDNPTPCGANGCCIAGNTVVDATYTAWGCGVGLELNSSGGPSSVKSAYAGPVKCFDITLGGSSGGNILRISYTQEADMTGKVAPFVELEARSR
jgi:hypothetical protein